MGSYFWKEDALVKEEVKENHKMKNINSELMNQFANSEEMEIYATKSLNQLIDYKWDSHAQSHHIYNFLTHLLYMFLFILYVITIYMKDHTD